MIFFIRPTRRKNTDSNELDPKIVAVIAYLFGAFSGFFVLLTGNKNSDVRFHAWNSIFLSLSWIIITFTSGLVGVLLPDSISHLFGGIILLESFCFFLVLAYCLIRVLLGKRTILPLISVIPNKKAPE